MRKVKKINGYLVVRFNEREKQGYPQYQKDGLEALAEAGILDSPETWAGRFGRDMTVGEAVGIMGKLLAWMRTAGENPAG